MFEDALAALTPRSASVFERELRRLLDSCAPAARRPGPVVVELAEDFEHHPPREAATRSGPGVECDPHIGSDGDATDAEAVVGVVADSPGPDNGVLLPGALALDAQFTAGTALLAEVRAAQVAIGREEARRARALAGFAASRPVSGDRSDAEVGAAAAASRAARPSVLAGVSEWAVDEVAVALGIPGAAATRLLADSLRLVHALPATLAALEAGDVTWEHVRVMVDLVAPLRDEVRGQAEARLLARIAGKTPPQLREAARRVVARLDAESIRRRVVAAVRERGVRLYPGEDGMATWAAVLPLPVARAVHDALEQYADAAATPGDERTRAQRMADCLVDLVLRPGEHGMAPVQAKLTVVAAVQTLLGSDEPGEVDGDLVPAAMVRELATELGLMPLERPAAEPGGAEPEKPEEAAGAAIQPDSAPVPAGDLEAAADGPAETARAAGRRRALADLVTTGPTSGTALAHRPHLALVDQLTGTLVALTDATALRTAARTEQGLGPPPTSPGYRPGAALDRYVRHRDRRCRFPGCRARAHRCDLDHTLPWPHGRTSAGNLRCLCRHHHRLSHQAPGWSLRALPDGGLSWTTPTGQALTTHPPRYGSDDDLRPGRAASAPAPGGSPVTEIPVPPEEDPPPF